MSTPPQHEDRHSHCGGLWIRGICTRCQKQCECSVYARFVREHTFGLGGTVRERDADGRITKFDLDYVILEPTRTVRPEDVKPGRWSEHDDD